jgi:hypothetical protein
MARTSIVKAASEDNSASNPLVICERTGSWAEALRQAAIRLGRPAISIVETRSTAECRRFLQKQCLGERRTTSAGVPLVVELSIAAAAEGCEFLAWHARRFGDAPRIVVASREAADYEAIVREAGATSFTASPRDVRPCVAEYLRFRDDPVHVVVDDRRTLIERIRDSLPWRPVVESAASGESC